MSEENEYVENTPQVEADNREEFNPNTKKCNSLKKHKFLPSMTEIFNLLWLLWEEPFTASFSINFYLEFFTNLIMAAYCFSRLHGVSDRDEILLFVFDAFYPTTVTFMLSILTQNLVGNQKDGSRRSMSIILLGFTLVYMTFCGNVNELTPCMFTIFIYFTVFLNILCLCAVGQIQSSLSNKPNDSAECT